VKNILFGSIVALTAMINPGRATESGLAELWPVYLDQPAPPPRTVLTQEQFNDLKTLVTETGPWQGEQDAYTTALGKGTLRNPFKIELLSGQTYASILTEWSFEDNSIYVALPVFGASWDSNKDFAFPIKKALYSAKYGGYGSPGRAHISSVVIGLHPNGTTFEARW
jgi:hypothetical protein